MTNTTNYKKIKGVNAQFYSDSEALIAKCKTIETALAKEEITSDQATISHTPWLISPDVFTFDTELKKKLEAIGQGISLFFDAIQQLYPINEEVQAILDYGVEDDLKGLELDKRITTFRLDVIIENQEPKIAEIEETYSGIGLMHALSQAYPINCDYFYERIAASNIKYLLVDDQWEDYLPELRALQRRLKTQAGIDTQLKYFSEFKEDFSGTALRYEYTKDLCQYSRSHRQKIVGNKMDYINPLFHGYASKAVFALFFKESLKEEWINRIGQDYYDLLYRAFPKSEMLINVSDDKIQSLIDNRKKTVIKVIHSPEDLDYNWGARGVYFGDTNKKVWTELLKYIQRGEIPYKPHIKNVIYMQMKLVESDRYDVPFWDRENNQLSLMPKARIRLQPIFYRNKDQMELVASMATFVNTSRKVHLGNHAIQVPVEFV